MSTRVHLSLRVADLERSVSFYTSLFGTAPDKRHDDYARFMPEQAPILLSLIPGRGDSTAGRLDHLGLRLADSPALAAATDRLQQAGLTPRVETDASCCYAIQDKLWLADPDGHAWEVYVVTDEQSAEIQVSPPGCCQ